MKTLSTVLAGLNLSTRELDLTDALSQYLDSGIDSLPSNDDLYEHVRTYIDEQSIVYYTNAIQYLAENDPSLQGSMELASQCGYSTNLIDSELLANLLYQENMVKELSFVWDDAVKAINEAKGE